MIEIMVIVGVLSMIDEPPTPPPGEAKAKEESKESAPAKRLRKKSAEPPKASEDEEAKKGEAPAEEGRPLPKPDEIAPKSDLDEALKRSLKGGLADEEEEDPIARIASRMSEAEGELARKESRPGSIPVQEKIVVELDELIKSLENPPPSPSDPNQQKPDDAKKKKKRQNQGQRQRQVQMQARQPQTGEPRERIGPPAPVREKLTPQEEERMVWGHLSDMLREEMGQYAKESFLPQYRDDIERYYTEIARRSKERGKP